MKHTSRIIRKYRAASKKAKELGFKNVLDADQNGAGELLKKTFENTK